jgi:hypothetical protein
MMDIPKPLYRFKDWLNSDEMPIILETQKSPFTQSLWKRILQNSHAFKETFDYLIQDNPHENEKTILSRGKIISYAQHAYASRLPEDRKLLLLSVLIWGYGDKHRGDNVPRSLAVPHLDKTLNNAMQYLEQHLIEEAFSCFTTSGTSIDHLNSSFFTKILHFFGLATKTQPMPLILDSKVVKAWTTLTQSPLNQYAVKDYIIYIETVDQWANYLNCRADAIEYLLFISPHEFLER